MDLRAWLEKKDLTVPEFARVIHVAPSTIYNWFKDRRSAPKHDVIRSIYKASRCQVAPCDLFHLRCPYRPEPEIENEEGSHTDAGHVGR
jgi:transcriptional regulator with XRE-family HTH domain